MLAELPRLLSKTLCSDLRKLREINLAGVDKLLQNVTVLRQTLSNLIPQAIAPFEQARQYLELLKLGRFELLDYVATKQADRFSLEEYKVLMHVIIRIESCQLDDPRTGTHRMSISPEETETLFARLEATLKTRTSISRSLSLDKASR